MRNKKEFFKEVGIGVSKAILIALFAGAVVIAPGGVAGTLHVVEKLFEGKRVRRYDEEKIKRSLEYLKSRKLIDIQKQYQKEVFSLTKLGYFRVRKLLKSFGIRNPKKWDGKWRMVLFDVPERKKNERDVFRQQLKNLGLANVQQSVWVHPFECRAQVYYLAGNLFIKPYVRYAVVEKITGDEDLRKRFGV